MDFAEQGQPMADTNDTSNPNRSLSVWDVTAQAEKDFKIPTGLLRGLGMEESSGLNQYDAGGNTIQSGTGPRGAFQFTQATASEMGINRDDPTENILGAAKYLRQNYRALKPLIRDDHEAWAAAAVAHNRGLGAVQGMIRNRQFEPSGKDSGNGGDTRTYATRILNNWANLRDGKTGASFDDQSQNQSSSSFTIGPGTPTPTAQTTPEEKAAFDARFPAEMYSPGYVEPQKSAPTNPTNQPLTPTQDALNANPPNFGVLAPTPEQTQQPATPPNGSEDAAPPQSPAVPTEQDVQAWLQYKGLPDNAETRKQFAHDLDTENAASPGLVDASGQSITDPAALQAQTEAANQQIQEQQVGKQRTQEAPLNVPAAQREPTSFKTSKDILDDAGLAKTDIHYPVDIPKGYTGDRTAYAVAQVRGGIKRDFGLTDEQAKSVVGDNLDQPIDANDNSLRLHVKRGDLASVIGWDKVKADYDAERAGPTLDIYQQVAAQQDKLNQSAGPSTELSYQQQRDTASAIRQIVGEENVDGSPTAKRLDQLNYLKGTPEEAQTDAEVANGLSDPLAYAKLSQGDFTPLLYELGKHAIGSFAGKYLKTTAGILDSIPDALPNSDMDLYSQAIKEIMGRSLGDVLGKTGNRIEKVVQSSTPDGEIFHFVGGVGDAVGALPIYAVATVATGGNPIFAMGAVDYLSAKGAGGDTVGNLKAGGTGAAMGALLNIGGIFGKTFAPYVGPFLGKLIPSLGTSAGSAQE